MARPTRKARQDPTEAARESLTVPYVVSSGSCRSSVAFPECVIGLVLESIHSRFGDGPGWDVAKSGVSPRQGTLEPRHRLASCRYRRPCRPAGRGPRPGSRRGRAAVLDRWRRSSSGAELRDRRLRRDTGRRPAGDRVRRRALVRHRRRRTTPASPTRSPWPWRSRRYIRALVRPAYFSVAALNAEGQAERGDESARLRCGDDYPGCRGGGSWCQ